MKTKFKFLLFIFSVCLLSCSKQTCYVCQTNSYTNGYRNGYGTDVVYCDKSEKEIREIEKNNTYSYSKNGSTIVTITKCK